MGTPVVGHGSSETIRAGDIPRRRSCRVVFRLAASLQAAAQATEPVPESCLVRAARIAAHYWDDPAKWAALDPFGKGVLACLREVDADYPLANVSIAPPDHCHRQERFIIWPSY